MAEENIEICGFLDVKFFGNKSKVHKVKKRTLGPWKVWKRHWCSVKKLGPGLGVKVQLDYVISSGSSISPNDNGNSITIPLDAIIHRTQSRSKQFAFGIFPTKDRKPLLYLAGNSETESQRWMANIRQLLKPRKYKFTLESYSISMVDNGHSKASGLTGLYGDLVTSTLGVFIKDIHTGQTIQSFEWKELGQFHLSTAGRPEDVRCICVIHTTKEYRGGVGELNVFCLDATKLLLDLVTQGRGPRNRQINRRPFSLSEGDLRILTQNETLVRYPVFNDRTDLKTYNRRRESNENYEVVKCKIPNRTTGYFYQLEPPSIPFIGGNSGGPSSSKNRISDVSIASGIYEEIADQRSSNVTAATSSFMEVDEELATRHPDEPPPLPPRQRCASESVASNRFQNVRMSRSNIVSMTSARNFMHNGRNAFALQKIIDNSHYVPMSPRIIDTGLQNRQPRAALEESEYVMQSERNVFVPQRIMDESHYVPMSPRLKDIALLEAQTPLHESDYVIMR
ncbi:uncharacterized protein LOC117609464 [Osmia lignaria lignaria]|uniref:uncharacterized protein LOC117609464 n=1 Tax=Osmia lignaria lignaria TaxID=1437193 RepID=UPI00402BB6B3